jgi:hypothetical protein
MTTIKATLPNGMIIEGTEAQIVETAQKLGCAPHALTYEPLYYSESRGESVPISTMNVIHAKNAAMKLYEGWLLDLRTCRTPKEFIEMIKTGPTDITLGHLLKHIATHEEW